MADTNDGNQTNDAQADGYYAEDDMGADNLDLSFLDEDKSDGKSAGSEKN